MLKTRQFDSTRIKQGHDAKRMGLSVASRTQSLRFSVQTDKSETSGPIISHFYSGAKPLVVLGLSPTSSSTNRTRLRAILDWLLPQAEHITVLDGCWFHRWDLVVFDRLSLEDATARALLEMRRLHRRVRELAEELDAIDKVTLVPWPETHGLCEMSAIRADLVSASKRCPNLAEALQDTVTDYLSGLHKHDLRGIIPDDWAALLNYVIEEVSALVHLSRQVSPMEVYPGPELPLMRRIADGEFHDVFPYDLSRRSHLSLALIELAEGNLREGTPSDWPEIERLIRAWPTHFVEEAVPLVRADFFQHQTMLCDNGTGQVLGFMIWRTDGRELELLWMAAEPSDARRGIGRSVVQAVLYQRSVEHRVFLRTATTDSVIPNTACSDPNYDAITLFFQSLGFILGTRHEGCSELNNSMVEIGDNYEY